MLFGQAGPRLVARESKEICRCEPETGLVNVEGDVVLSAHLQELLKIAEEILNGVRMPQPTIDVIGQVRKGSSRFSVRSLRLRSAVLLPERQDGRLESRPKGVHTARASRERPSASIKGL
jgi:hypothetical protein